MHRSALLRSFNEQGLPGHPLHGIEAIWTNVETGAALDALALVDNMCLPFATGNGIDRAGPQADAATLTLVRYDLVGDKRFAAQRRATFLIYVSLILLSEIANRGEDWVGCGLSQTAE